MKAVLKTVVAVKPTTKLKAPVELTTNDDWRCFNIKDETCAEK